MHAENLTVQQKISFDKLKYLNPRILLNYCVRQDKDKDLCFAIRYHMKQFSDYDDPILHTPNLNIPKLNNTFLRKANLHAPVYSSAEEVLSELKKFKKESVAPEHTSSIPKNEIAYNYVMQNMEHEVEGAGTALTKTELLHLSYILYVTNILYVPHISKKYERYARNMEKDTMLVTGGSEGDLGVLSDQDEDDSDDEEWCEDQVDHMQKKRKDAPCAKSIGNKKLKPDLTK